MQALNEKIIEDLEIKNNTKLPPGSKLGIIELAKDVNHSGSF